MLVTAQRINSYKPGKEGSDARARINLQRLGEFENKLHYNYLVGDVIHQIVFLQPHNS